MRKLQAVIPGVIQVPEGLALVKLVPGAPGAYMA